MNTKEFAEKLVKQINYVYCDQYSVDVQDDDIFIYPPFSIVSGAVLDLIANECKANNLLYCVSIDMITHKMYIRLMINELSI